jgi:hypothetical protein
MSDTPRTDKILFTFDVCDGENVVQAAVLAESLKLNAANERIKRLEEAGDALDARLGCGCMYCGPCRVCQSASENWDEAKEAKP